MEKEHEKRGLKWWIWLVLVLTFLVMGYLSWGDGFDDGYSSGRELMFNSCVNYVCDLQENQDGIKCIDGNSAWTKAKDECLYILFYEGEIIGGKK